MNQFTLRILCLSVILAIMSGCASQQCVVNRTGSVRIVDGAGNVLLDKKSDTITLCPPSVSIAASGSGV